MRELRTQDDGHPFCALYAFDPRRMAILLRDGDETDDSRWYDVNLEQLRRDGAMDG